ncbi:MAG: hutI [Firmicutes bacterium]|nr:hutI [Bacillota bacterium]
MRTIIKNIGLLATAKGTAALRGEAQGALQMTMDTYVVIENGIIVEVGANASTKDLFAATGENVVDAQGLLVTPGLVDAHTHLIFAGWRQHEFALKLQGMSYLDILAAGGGIISSVNNTRKASVADLVTQGKTALSTMLEYGTTTCEVKSGYGLTVADEIKSLRAIRELATLQPVDLVPTFMGAHAVPPEFKERSDDYVRLVCQEMIPAVAREKLAEFCDVFCEQGVFSVEQAAKILECGLRYGLMPKVHADEITSLGGAELAGRVKAISAEHLIHADDAGLTALAEAGVIAVLLPGTSFYLGESFARARDMMDKGIPVAIASDFNPGSCPNESLQIPMNIACLKYRMTPEEVITAVTLNGAAAINRAHFCGSIEPGKQGDLIIWNAKDLPFLFYHWGPNQVRTVIKNGHLVLNKC